MSTSVALAGLAAALASAGLSLIVVSFSGDRRSNDRPLIARVLGVWFRMPIAPPRGLEARLAAAGASAGLGVRELMAAKLACASAGAVLAAVVAAYSPGRLAVVLLAAGPVAAFLVPDLWLARQSAARANEIRRELPALLDLLRVSVESGSSLAGALADVGARSRGPLAREWRAAGRQVALGVPLERALDAMVASAPIAEVRALRAALDRARRHGVPLAETLAAQTRDARHALTRAAREQAARASPKIQLVVALLLVPSVLLLVAAALLAAVLDDPASHLP